MQLWQKKLGGLLYWTIMYYVNIYIADVYLQPLKTYEARPICLHDKRLSSAWTLSNST